GAPAAALRSPEWPWKVRVGANSPSLWPTMFSVTKTGKNFLPLCTANVTPTISGRMVERRDQVLRTFFDFVRCASITLVMRCWSAKALFLCLRAILLRLSLATATDEFVRLLFVPGLVALGRQAPRRARVAAAGGPPLAAAHGVVEGFHGDAAVVRAASEP